MTPEQSQGGGKDMAMTMIHDAIKEIFTELKQINNKLTDAAVQKNELEHVSKDVGNLKAGAIDTDERLTAAETGVATLRKDFDAIIGDKIEVKKQVRGFWWEMIKWVAIGSMTLLATNFPKIAKWAVSVVTVTAPK
jgi:hypothetical protein